MKYEFIRNHAEEFELNDMCEALVIHRSRYSRWRDGNVSERKLKDNMIKEAIMRIYDEAKGRYGYRPIHAHLKEEEMNCGRDRTLRLMNELGLSSIQKKRFKPQGTDSDHLFGYSPNLLKDLGEPERCDQVWVADTTYLSCEHGWMYLATVMDLFSRRIVGWSVSPRNNTSLICEALRAAVLSRGTIPPGLIHHSDRGSTYASDGYLDLLNSEFMDSSMSAKGNCYDNAAMESFYGRFKTSSVRRYQFSDEAEVRAHVFDYVEVFYNRYRKHSSLGYQNPLQFEAQICPPRGAIQKNLAVTASNQ